MSDDWNKRAGEFVSGKGALLRKLIADEIGSQCVDFAPLPEKLSLLSAAEQIRELLASQPTELTLSTGADAPWSVRQVLSKLVEATEHLFLVHDCDCYGWENTEHAVKAARAMLSAEQPTEPEQRKLNHYDRPPVVIGGRDPVPDPLRCLVTGNPCGTDTRPVGSPCMCCNCRSGAEPAKLKGDSKPDLSAAVRALREQAILLPGKRSPVFCGELTAPQLARVADYLESLQGPVKP